MVWSDNKIKPWASSGGITPFDEKLVNPASLDLRMSEFVARPITVANGWCDANQAVRYGDKEAMKTLWGEVQRFEELILYPGEPVLMASMERIKIPDNACGLLFSKSTFGRCLVEHAHAGFFDPGFDGTGTFEFFHVGKRPITFKPGDRVVQLVLLDMVNMPSQLYGETGRYQGQVLPTAPRGW